MADAHSAEFSGLTAHPVIALMPDQVGITAKGGTMRLGKYPCVLAEGYPGRAAYGAADISERHRHRYEFNNQFRRELQDAGLRLAGLSPDGHLVEIVEEPANTWFVGGCSSTRSSRAVPTGPIRCLWASCRRLWTGRDDGGGPWRIHWNAETAPAPRGGKTHPFSGRSSMASFTNMATLSYNGSQINSNVVTGELRDALTITKTAVSGGYRPGDTVTYVVTLSNTGTAA